LFVSLAFCLIVRLPVWLFVYLIVFIFLFVHFVLQHAMPGLQSFGTFSKQKSFTQKILHSGGGGGDAKKRGGWVGKTYA
jgi:hypothetical protein